LIVLSNHEFVDIDLLVFSICRSLRRSSANIIPQHSSSSRESTEILSEWSRKEQENKVINKKEELRAQLDEEIHPSRRLFHKFIILISAIVGLSAFNMALGQVVGVMFEKTGIVQYVIRMYVIMLCLLVMLVELEWTKFARESTILRLWITRGLFYAFIGVLGIDQNENVEAKNSNDSSIHASLLYLKAVAWLMVGCGCLYFFLGAFCLQLLYNSQRSDYQQRLERAGHIREATDRFGTTV
jgi:hypothetical protein